MRSGTDYRQALRDGRKVWVMGEGPADDVTAHPATRAVVDEYIRWYDRHADPAWADRLLATDGTARAATLPRSATDLRAMGRSFVATTFQNAGNITHTPAYGHLIALGLETAVRAYGRFPADIASAAAYREHIGVSGRFLTFCAGHPTIGTRLKGDPADRIALRSVRETDAGLVVSGRIGMHTSPAFAEDVYIGAGSGLETGGHRATLVVPLNAPGVTVVCRKPAAHEKNPFAAPWSSRFDELDGQLWLDEVFVPHERVFRLDANIDPIARWLFWHQLICWLSKAEFALGLALACADAMGLRQHPQTVDLLMDIVTAVQTVRSCVTAAELDPQFTPEGYCYPNHNHIAAGSIAMLKARQGITETLRVLPVRRWWSPRPTPTWPIRSWRRGWRTVLAVAVTRPRSGRRCSRPPGITRRRLWTAASRRSSCTPTAASPSGAAGSGAASPTTTNWPMRCWGCWRFPCRHWILAPCGKCPWPPAGR
jgi:aromatic ring hydroxylase